ncbi:alkene reductase [Roseomonas sp. 18066]|uniref:oxidoreductase n=1 Tax=Roseomonas sp. 18066 TaxID=2681412 RepID=UPI00135B66B1|nr:alkene reductase [Roseomonas sp. 18066]
MHGIDPARPSFALGALTLANRLVASPAPLGGQRYGGLPHPRSAALYAAQAEAGLIVTERCWVTPQGADRAFSPGLRNAAQAEGWAQIAEAVHQAGGRIALRLWHAGRRSHRAVQLGGSWPVAPSALAGPGQIATPLGPRPLPVPRALATEEIPGVIEDFLRAARRARAAGFDAVELDASGHGLIEQFLDADSNQRVDAYGGDAGRRLRFLDALLAGLTTIWEPGRLGLRLAGRAALVPEAPVLRAARLADAHGLAWLHLARSAAPASDLAQLRRAYGGALLRGHAVAGAEEGLADLVALPAWPRPAALPPPPAPPVEAWQPAPKHRWAAPLPLA